MELKKGARLKNRYEIVRQLGVGGFGATYLAIDNLIMRYVAIKCSESSLTHEAKILKALNNVPHISHMYDHFSENGMHFIVMRYIKGKSLNDYRKESGGTLNIAVLKLLLPSLIISLDQMHERGIIHRDISPGNIMISEDNVLYLIDFGSATALKEAALKNHLVFTHKGLESPEFSDASKQGTWTDVYSLCSTIVYLLTGNGVPLPEERMTYDPVPSLMLGLSLNARMQNALIKGLAVEREKRYSTVREFASVFLGDDKQRNRTIDDYKVHYHARTDIGSRPVNQDNFMIDKLFAYAGEDCEIKGNIECAEGKLHIVAVADGVAGVNHGELASKAAIQAISHFLDNYRDSDGLMSNLVEELLNQINEKIISLGKKIGRTATTIVIMCWKNNEFCVANIGDSPIYRLSNKKLEHISVEHTLAKYKMENDLPVEVADFHALTRYLGKTNTSGSDMAYITSGTINEGDIFLLCSDGIDGSLTDRDKRKMIKQDGDKAIDIIFKKAHKNEHMDNCTAVILKF